MGINTDWFRERQPQCYTRPKDADKQLKSEEDLPNYTTFSYTFPWNFIIFLLLRVQMKADLWFR